MGSEEGGAQGGSLAGFDGAVGVHITHQARRYSLYQSGCVALPTLCGRWLLGLMLGRPGLL